MWPIHQPGRPSRKTLQIIKKNNIKFFKLEIYCRFWKTQLTLRQWQEKTDFLLETTKPGTDGILLPAIFLHLCRCVNTDCTCLEQKMKSSPLVGCGLQQIQYGCFKWAPAGGGGGGERAAVACGDTATGRPAACWLLQCLTSGNTKMETAPISARQWPC